MTTEPRAARSHLDTIVGRNVRDMRVERDLNTAEIEQRCAELGIGMSRHTLQRIERGERGPKVTELVALAFALRVSPAKLLFPRINDESVVHVGDGPRGISTPRFGWWLARPDEDPPADYADRQPAPVLTEPATAWRELFRRTLPLNVEEVAQSITELRSQQRRYAESSAIYAIDLDWRITSWNQGCQNLYGYDEHEALGMWVFNLFSDRKHWAAKREGLHSEIQQLVDAGLPLELPANLRETKQGHGVWVRSWLSPIEINATMVGIGCVDRSSPGPDFEPDLKEHAGAAVVEYDPSGRVSSWSPEAEELFGRSAAETMGGSWLQHAKPPAPGVIENAVRALLADGTTKIDLTITRPDRSEIPIRVTAVNQYDAFGGIESTTAYITRTD